MEDESRKPGDKGKGRLSVLWEEGSIAMVTVNRKQSRSRSTSGQGEAEGRGQRSGSPAACSKETQHWRVRSLYSLPWRVTFFPALPSMRKQEEKGVRSTYLCKVFLTS